MCPRRITLSSDRALLHIAQAAARAGATDPMQGYVAITFAAFTLEAMLNTFALRVDHLIEATSRDKESDGPLVPMSIGLHALGPRASVKSRIDLIVGLLREARVDWGSQPFQDCTLLFDLRDWIVHLRPEVHETGGPPRRRSIAAGLSDRGLITRDLVEQPHSYILTRASVAAWAVAVPPALARFLAPLVPWPMVRHTVDWMHTEYEGTS